MLLSSIPTKWASIWAALAGTGFIRSGGIPPTAVGGAASQTLGFPPITATPIAAGGIPPNIADMNTALNNLSAWVNWQQGGGPIQYDGTWSSNFGGYANGAVIQSAVNIGTFYVSTVDNNTSDPDTGGANWVSFPRHGQVQFATSNTWVCPAGVSRVYVEVWGGGGGSVGGVGASGAAGGYAAGWISVVPGTTYTVTIGDGGTATGISAGGNGGTSNFQSISATGGAGGGSGPGPGGSGSGGMISIQGQGGTDLTDAGTFFSGICSNAIGGNAPRGGMGGNINSGGGGGGIAPTTPGGGGGANAANNAWCQAGAAGGVTLTW